MTWLSSKASKSSSEMDIPLCVPISIPKRFLTGTDRAAYNIDSQARMGFANFIAKENTGSRH